MTQTTSDRIHPLTPEMVKSMRAYAETDRYHGATWETIVTLCDEVDLQRTQIKKLKVRIQELERRIEDGSQAHKQASLSCDDQSGS